MISNLKGATFLVDGQFGSTGKGLLAAYMASKHAHQVEMVVTNAGPNSGHTCYYGDEKIVLKQLPTFAVYAKRMGYNIPVYISAGAIIDPDILNAEVKKYGVNVFVSAMATMITPEDKEAEHSGSIAAVAGTRQGVGAALARKINREPSAVIGKHMGYMHHNISCVVDDLVWNMWSTFVEVSQGFSLGLNSEFYPKVTSRECTVMQAMADARISPAQFAGSMMAIRTYPIRVGNVDGHSSGDCYEDQEEVSWESIGVEPEMTTVTKRVRRVFTFSLRQYRDALRANVPGTVFVNFMNYLKPDERGPFMDRLREHSLLAIGRVPKFLYGYGPLVTDVHKELI